MSNRTLRDRLTAALDSFRKGESTLAALRDAVVMNGCAMEAMPYALVEEIRHIEYSLTIAQWMEEDGFLPDTEVALSKLESWLVAVPVDL